MVCSRLACLAIATLALGAARCGGSNPKPADAGTTGGAGGAAGGTGGATGGSAGGAGGSAGTGGSATGGRGGSGGSADAAFSDAIYDTAPVPSSIPLEMAAGLFAAVACEKVFACCTEQERMRNVLLATQQGCEFGFGSLLQALMVQANTAIAANRAMYDPMALAGCLSRYQTQTCEQARATGGISAYRMCNFIKPLVQLGGVCVQSIECINGYCNLTPGAMMGTCTAKLADGQMCTFADQCQGGACRPAGATTTCATAAPDGLCAAL
jgi:hypothetical protein